MRSTDSPLNLYALRGVPPRSGHRLSFSRNSPAVTGLLNITVRLPYVLTVFALSALTHSPASAQSARLLYPEDVFPELRPLLHTALENSPELEGRQASVEERQGQSLSQAAASRSRVVASTRILAGYELRYNPGLDDDSPIETVENRARLGLDASVWWYKPLFYWGNNERQREIADLYVSASELEFAEASRRHLTTVRETYLSWIGARHQTRVARENIELAERFVANRRQLLDIGRTSQQEILELEAGLYEAQEMLALYSREETNFRNQLAIMVGDEVATARLEREVFPEVTLLSLDDIEALRAELRVANPDSPAIEREETYARADETYYEAVKRGSRPTVDLVVGAHSDRVDSYNIEDSAYRLSSYAGFEVRWNIFDGHRNRGERIAALARVRAREARVRMAEMQTLSMAERLLANLELSVRQVEARAARADLLARRLELAENPDNAELIAPIDRLELRLNHLRAQTRVVDAKIQYLTSMGMLAALYYADPVGGQ